MDAPTVFFYDRKWWRNIVLSKAAFVLLEFGQKNLEMQIAR
jgi:hypothetical protein